MISDYLLEWLNIAARWIHIFAGIMWVGQTYFFTWLDGRFTEMMKGMSEGKSENRVWMVHSGGFYLVDKQKKPKMMPHTLHWFKWEAATTWLSGVVLLIVVYYMGGLMVSEQMEESEAIIVGIAVLLLAWPVYDALCKFIFTRNEKIGAVVSFVFLVAVIYGSAHMLEGRAAFLHVGAMLGTLMTANVWIRIIPAQRKMVAALQQGKEPDLTLGEQAKMRSKHNTFMAVPVVFTMISNHYPVTSYGSNWSWVILSALMLIGWGAAKVIRRA
jgi:uncharacterized membrane protein